MSSQYKEKTSQILIRVKPSDKERIKGLARKCGLNTTEYIKQRALGYEPRAVPPDALFHLLKKFGNLESKSTSTELNAEIAAVLKEITAAFLLPGKGDANGCYRLLAGLRQSLRNKVRHEKPPEVKEKNCAQRAEITRQIDPLRKNLRRAKDVLEKSLHIYELLKTEHELDRKTHSRYLERSR